MTIRASRRRAALWIVGIGAAIGISMPSGCANEPVGHTKTVEKTTVATPSGTTTTTETREKDTTIIDRP